MLFWILIIILRRRKILFLNACCREQQSDDFIRQYRYLAPLIGRNNALFRMGSMARDRGWSLADATAALLDAHVVQQATGSHVEEGLDQRRQEGLCTLASAFRYPPKPRLQSKASKPGLPNAIREALLQRDLVSIARLFDGLIMAGMERKTQFTEKAACDLVRAYGIGRRTVQAALRSLRALTESPQTPQKTLDANAAIRENKRKNNCSFVTSANRVKTFGRPAQIYVLPTNGQLYRWLGVRPSGSDRLDSAALQSPTAYRQAMQKALIERRPGHYSRGWLAGRLGISVWTSRRYDRALGVTVQPSYHEDRIYWSNVEHLPLQTHATRPQGIFIQTADGRSYPPLRSIATRLLRQKQSIVLKRRHWNYYRIYNEISGLAVADKVESGQQDISEEIHKYAANEKAGDVQISESSHTSTVYKPEERQPLDVELKEPEMYLWVCPGCMKTHLNTDRPGDCGKCQRSDWECVPAAIWQDVDRCKAWWSRRYQQFREDRLAPGKTTSLLTDRQLRIADRLYQQIRQSTPDHAITRSTARRLVREQGVEAVSEALKLLGERSTIRNAAGFIITVLRGSQRSESRQIADGAADHTAWVEKLRQSPYAQYYANADQFLNESSQQNMEVGN